MHIALLTNEYPPFIYGGAGVHVDFLSRELERVCRPEDRLTVLCFGDQQRTQGNLTVCGISGQAPFPSPGAGPAKVLGSLYKNLVMAGSLEDVDIVHCHTWYTFLAGCLIKQLFSASLVLTTHSLEPHRPWKAAQLGTGYQASTWLERIAFESADGVIAVSGAMKQDVCELYGLDSRRIEIIHNGIDTSQYAPTHDPDVLTSLGIDPARPYVLFVGRLTAQKGVFHLLRAIDSFRPDAQVVLCAASPDNREIAEAMEEAMGAFRDDPQRRVVWLSEPVAKDRLIALYSQAAVFVCPSVYEPFGIINLEAMACGTPVVASAVGGIPEIVVPGETGCLVPLEPTSDQDPEPRNPEEFSRRLAQAVNSILDDPAHGSIMGEKARQRAKETFSWRAIADRTMSFYRRLIQGSGQLPSVNQAEPAGLR